MDKHYLPKGENNPDRKNNFYNQQRGTHAYKEKNCGYFKI